MRKLACKILDSGSWGWDEDGRVRLYENTLMDMESQKTKNSLPLTCIFKRTSLTFNEQSDDGMDFDQLRL